MDERAIAAAVEKIVRGLKPEGEHSCKCSAFKLTLDKAKRLCEAVEARAKEMGVKAVVAVADNGGNPVAVQSMDGAYLASWDIALQKSYTVVALKMSTTELAALAAPGAPLYGIQFTNQGKIVIFGGGDLWLPAARSSEDWVSAAVRLNRILHLPLTAEIDLRR